MKLRLLVALLLLLPAAALADSNHIAFAIDFNVRQPALPQHFHECSGAPGFLEGWRFDFRDLDNFSNQAIVILCDKILSSLKFGIRQYALNIRALKDEARYSGRVLESLGSIGR